MNHPLRPLLLALAAAFGLAASAQYTYLTPGTADTAPRYEVRAAWLTTLWGLDWPRTRGEAAQKAELRRTLDALAETGINVVLLQTRVRGTVIYPSSIEPWDACLTGRAGAKGWDVLQFAVDECHRRGMELHAWVVCFPLGKVSAVNALGDKSLPRRRPELCSRAADEWLMDPGVPQTADYLADLCREMAARYDIDGMHLDYIRYPEHTIPFNDTATFRRHGRGSLKAWRTANVTRCVERIHRAVKAVKPWLKLSCSPVGKYADLPRQSSMGWNARDAVCQDAQEWLRRGWMDWLLPMMYFDGKHFYPFAYDWQTEASGRVVAPGLGIYFLDKREKDWSLTQITRQLSYLRKLGCGGAGFFRTRFLLDNHKGLRDHLKNEFYARRCLTPPMTWQDNTPPSRPVLRMKTGEQSVRLSWTTATDDSGLPVRYNVYHQTTDTLFDARRARLLAVRLEATAYEHLPALPSFRYGLFAVTAIDRYGNESEPAVVLRRPRAAHAAGQIKNSPLKDEE